VPQLIRVGTVIWLSTNLSAFNQWVRDIFFTGLPNALASVVLSSTGNAASSVSATAALFDNIWNQIWVIVGTAWSMTGLSATGIIMGISGFLTGVVCGLGLVLIALVYVTARMVLAVIVCLAPVLIGCAMFEITRPIFDRAVGKVISLILLQTLGLIILQILLLGDQWFVAQATTAMLSSISNSAATVEALQALVGLAVWFLAGAFAMYSLPAVAYSIGSGVSMSSPSLIGWALLAMSRTGGGKNGSQDASFSNGGGSPPLSLSLSRPELSAGGEGPPPPAPLSIAHSTRR
jgi:type IV secretion system protein VirB6